MSQKITWKDKLDFILFGWIINWAFPQYYRPKYHYTRYRKILLINVIPQKILGINRFVKWPVHFTSVIHSPEKITKGILCDPGDNPGIYIQANNGIIFGNNVGIGTGTKIISANHNKEEHSKHDTTSPIIIGNDVFIYANSVVLPGVKIGDNVVIGAGSIVTKDIPANSVAVGNPCKVIKHNPPHREKFTREEFNKNIPKQYHHYFDISSHE
ncbi:DapH/DapD/GlmU-related protein [Elizabethkingia sp. JS20170427COW]|uniref:DapH/DapD/GlmU-related protein n=1 Tax=Elizabethkingia sp. JS20170427COW TaxID=2583851 RepID=UPI001110DDAD|nr:DapH/DapD/GlmU-related protein [Elizabethkingia sp. JS20170427COW]QCX53213.1 acyltransferase [Elizabethkingia sp. JS20170427COW]